MTISTETDAGDLLRQWRQRRRLSQQALAGRADLSTRHLSFVENGRSAASRDMLMRLADGLGLPHRERDRLLVAGGYAPPQRERGYDAPEMALPMAVVEAVLKGHEPWPALAVDRCWSLVRANAAAAQLLARVDPALLAPPVNVLRVSLHPDGLADLIENLGEWRHHILHRLRRDADMSGDARLEALHDELAALPTRAGRTPPRPPNPVAVPLLIRHPQTGQRLSFLSTTTVFGTATDVTLSELTLECFFPADDETRAAWTGAS